MSRNITFEHLSTFVTKLKTYLSNNFLGKTEKATSASIADGVSLSKGTTSVSRYVYFADTGATTSKAMPVYDDDFKYNPGTNELTVGSITGNAATATKAIQDGDGNTITSTYLPLSGGIVTGGTTFNGLLYSDSTLSGISGASKFRLLPYLYYDKLPSQSSSTSTFCKELLVWICENYSDTNTIYYGSAGPNSNGVVQIRIYSTNTVDSDTGLPQYSDGTFFALNGTTVRFGTNNYNWYYKSILLSNDSAASLTNLNANAITTGTVALARGGTGANTASDARVNLEVMGAAPNATGYYGMTTPDGTETAWIRTTSAGIIPYTSGGTSALGTSSWPFSKAYINNIYGSLDGIASYAKKLTETSDVKGEDNNNYPYRRIASVSTTSNSYSDADAILIISSVYNNGPFGIVKISRRTNNQSSTANGTANAYWLIRQGFSESALQSAILLNTNNKTTTVDWYLKLPYNYPRIKIYTIYNKDSMISILGSSETDSGTATNAYASVADACTALYSSTYTNIISASDNAIVNYSQMLTGFNSRSTGWTWGTIKSSNGYTDVTSLTANNGGVIAFGESNGDLSVQIDGKFYQNSGSYEVIDSNSIGSATAGNAKAVNITANTTTKAYLLGSTGSGTTPIYDSGVYLDTTAGQLAATKFVGSLSGTATNATTASYSNILNLTQNNEIVLDANSQSQFTGSTTGNYVWFGYRLTNKGTNSKITEYLFGDGTAGTNNSQTSPAAGIGAKYLRVTDSVILKGTSSSPTAYMKYNSSTGTIDFYS